ncbi:UNVERIFIED_CONTAM: hypothetical protein PYX00_011397 [Menopon gallinae]|uniref:Heat shock protein 90 n=1 Tax=Menopon gallinae TaxID=328185 RepID=A0AAW2H7V4_9NEOP
MTIIVNAIYSSKDFFIRELIANASDACDKLQLSWQEFTDKKLNVVSPNELRIDVIPDKKNKILVIQDNAIGMKKEHLITFLGTIARSGTQAFKEAVAQKGYKEAGQLIGQFGLGFYSAFLVAYKVDVITRHPEDRTYMWSSSGKGDFTIHEVEDDMMHGTKLMLHLKEGEGEFLECSTLTKLIKRFSMFISYPIYLHEEKEVEDKEEPEKTGDAEEKDVAEDEEAGEKEPEKLDAEEKDDEPKIEADKPKKMKTVIEQRRVNKDKQLWARDLKEVSQEELKDFYKSISNDWDDFLKVKSWSLEGVINFKMLLFIPKRAPFNMFDRSTKKDRIKLYCANVFVTDDLGDAVPDWMYFITGVIAAEDLPMSVSRETTQGSSVIKLIKKRLNAKVLEMIQELSGDKELYKDFLKEFSTNIKFAVREDQDSKGEEYAKLLRFYTSKSGEEMIDLDTYVGRMKENQKQIYVVTGMSKEEVTMSPFLQKFRNYEVIFLFEAIDEIMLQGFRKYKDYDIQRITSEGVELPEKEEVAQEVQTSYESLCSKLKDVLGTGIEKVVLNPALGSVPCLINSTKYGHSGAMEKILSAQPGAANNPFLSMGLSKKIFEINPTHPIICNMKALMDAGSEDELKEISYILYNTTLFGCGYKFDDTSKYCNAVYTLLSKHSPAASAAAEGPSNEEVEVA